jgi:hypothetical protein
MELHSHRALLVERVEMSGEEEKERGEECGTFMAASRNGKHCT